MGSGVVRLKPVSGQYMHVPVLNRPGAFVRELLEGEIDRYDPSANYIGRLQEHFQQLGQPIPVYSEQSRAGPSHQPVFM